MHSSQPVEKGHLRVAFFDRLTNFSIKKKFLIFSNFFLRKQSLYYESKNKALSP